eukprot:Rhum_TRINITY_DN14932_c12_g1::Rhum_TRINITY_DN14932_c12_g1_i1::g.129653::m.129653
MGPFSIHVTPPSPCPALDSTPPLPPKEDEEGRGRDAAAAAAATSPTRRGSKDTLAKEMSVEELTGRVNVFYRNRAPSQLDRVEGLVCELRSIDTLTYRDLQRLISKHHGLPFDPLDWKRNSLDVGQPSNRRPLTPEAAATAPRKRDHEGYAPGHWTDMDARANDAGGGGAASTAASRPPLGKTQSSESQRAHALGKTQSSESQRARVPLGKTQSSESQRSRSGGGRRASARRWGDPTVATPPHCSPKNKTAAALPVTAPEPAESARRRPPPPPEPCSRRECDRILARIQKKNERHQVAVTAAQQRHHGRPPVAAASAAAAAASASDAAALEAARRGARRRGDEEKRGRVGRRRRSVERAAFTSPLPPPPRYEVSAAAEEEEKKKSGTRRRPAPFGTPGQAPLVRSHSHDSALPRCMRTPDFRLLSGIGTPAEPPRKATFAQPTPEAVVREVKDAEYRRRHKTPPCTLDSKCLRFTRSRSASPNGTGRRLSDASAATTPQEAAVSPPGATHVAAASKHKGLMRRKAKSPSPNSGGTVIRRVFSGSPSRTDAQFVRAEANVI